MYPGYTHTSWRPLQSYRACTLGILIHPGDRYNLTEHVPWVYSHILETSTILESMYPGYTHTSWRPLQSYRACTLGILTQPGDRYNLTEHVPWVYSHILETTTIFRACTLGILTHPGDHYNLQSMYPGYTHTSWRPLQSYRACTLGILTHPGDLYNLTEHVPWIYSHNLETSTILESMYPEYTHTAWRPLQSYRACTLGTLTHPGDLYNLTEHVPWVYSHILETSTILESMYPGYTHTSWRPLQSWRSWFHADW